MVNDLEAERGLDGLPRLHRRVARDYFSFNVRCLDRRGEQIRSSGCEEPKCHEKFIAGLHARVELKAENGLTWALTDWSMQQA